MRDLHVCLNNLQNVAPQVEDLLADARFVAALTGAGISLASGLPLVAETVGGIALRDFFRKSCIHDRPKDFYRTYRRILQDWRGAQPNAAHRALAERGVWVITQNIDGLHRDAGSNHLLELHGNLRELRCEQCEDIFQAELAWQSTVPECPRCGSMMYPGITFEGGEVRHWSRAVDWIGRAELLFIVGTSLEMSPVHIVPDIMSATGGSIVWINEAAEQIVPRLLT